MLPVQTVIPTRTRPRVVLGLIAVSLAAFVVELTASADTLPQIIAGYGLIPADVTWYAPVTALFLHHGWLHVGVDAWALWIFGPAVEDRLGHGRFLAYGLAAAATGMLAEAQTRGESPLPVLGGASLIAAVMAAHFVLFRRSKTLVLVPAWSGLDLVEIPTLLLVPFWLLLQAVGSSGRVAAAVATGGPAFVAPTASALAGVLLVHLVRRRSREGVDWWGK